MTESGLDFRKRQVDASTINGGFSFATQGVGVTSLVQPRATAEMMNVNEQDRENVTGKRVPSVHHRHASSLRGGNKELVGEPFTMFLLHGGSESNDGSAMLPGLRNSRLLARHEAHLGDRWNAEFITNSLPDEAVQADISYGNEALEDVGGSWNTLGHRRVHSAPNIMERMGELSGPASSRWGESGSPMPPSDVRKTSIHDHVIPEGRRYQALEPPLRSGISAVPDRPHSWRARSAAPPWDARAPSAPDLVARENGVEWMPKLRASYFVDVRNPREGDATTNPAGAPRSDTSSIVSMSTDARPFEEIKRMRLSQALDNGPVESVGLGKATSPTFSSCAGAAFEGARSARRFSPGNGVKVPGLNTLITTFRPGFGGGAMRDMGYTRQPLSPALTAPPTPPPARMDVKAHEADAYTCDAVDGGPMHPRSTELEKVVLPMEQRPPDEVNAVQALMSVGRGARTQTARTPVLEEGGDDTNFENDIQADTQVSQAPTPSPEPSKLLEGADEDDGLDKDLWVVVEKGSSCATADCVYRDPATRIASRRHYHSKCTHTHNGGVKKGMVFHHHQLEKVQKHQRSHQREATKSAPYKRTTPEDHQAMEGAGVEGYRPEDWKPEETRQLDELVNQLVAPVTHAWPSIARFFPTKSSIQCLLHWRFTLNDNGIIRGNGTWGAEEDARLRKLVPIFSSPATGPRWAKIAEVMPGRTAKQCRERYNNHVDPAIKKDKVWTEEEDELVMKLHAEHHNQFAKIARRIPGRCYDDVKNRFNLLVKRRQCTGKASIPASSPTATAVEATTGSSSKRECMASGERKGTPLMLTSENAGEIPETVIVSSGDPGHTQPLARKTGMKRPTPEISLNQDHTS